MQKKQQLPDCQKQIHLIQSYALMYHAAFRYCATSEFAKAFERQCEAYLGECQVLIFGNLQ